MKLALAYFSSIIVYFSTMKIVFFGTPEPAAEILEELIKAGHKIICVVTQPDRPKGRGQKVAFPPVKEVSLKHALPIEQPGSVKNNPVFSSLLDSLRPDLGVVVAYGKILPKEILAIPKYGFINVHASLLPKYRGAAPIQWALLKGEKETGISIFRLTELLDAGPILLQKKVKIKEEDTAEDLSERLFSEGSKLLLKALKLIEEGKAEYLNQDETQVTFAPSLTRESGEMDWRKSAEEIYDRTRALLPWPAAHTFCRGKRLKIFKAKTHVLDLVTGNRSPGMILQILKPEGFVVATGKGDLLVLEVQPEAGKRMKGYDFVIGHDVKAGEILPN